MGPDGPQQSGHAAVGDAGRIRGRRCRAPGRQHAGAGRSDGPGDIPHAQPAVAEAAVGARAAASRPVRGVAKLLDASGIAWQRRTALEHKAATVVRADNGWQYNCHPNRAMPQAASVPRSMPTQAWAWPPGATTGRGFMEARRFFLVDCVGELRRLVGTAQIAFVGGSMGSRGGQNMIEPAAYALPSRSARTPGTSATSWPRCSNGGRRWLSRDAHQFTEFVRAALPSPSMAAELGPPGQMLVQSQLGATQRTAELLKG